MLKHLLTGTITAALVLTAFAGFSQEKKEESKPQGPEKLMIYNGDNLKARFFGFVKFDVVSNSKNVQNESAPFLVESNKFMDTSYSTAAWTAALGATYGPIYGAVLAGRTPFVFGKTKAMNSGSLVADARHSRFGFDITGPLLLGAKTSALLEADFWGMTASSTTGNRQGGLRMRHAKVSLDWENESKTSRTYLLIGQFWSVVMPDPSCQPVMLTFIPFGKQGLLFMREAQITLGQTMGPKEFTGKFEVSMARAMAGDDAGASTTAGGVTVTNLYPGANFTQVDQIGGGEATKLPGFRSRLTFEIKPMDNMGIMLGGSGAYQKEKAALPNYLSIASVNYTVHSSMVDSAVAQAFGRLSFYFVSLLGVYWKGHNVDCFLSGLDQGIVWEKQGTDIAFPAGVQSVYRVYTIKSRAYYTQLIFDLNKAKILPLFLSLGMANETKTNGHYIAPNKILWNKSVMANIIYSATDYLKFGLETALMETKYKNSLGVAKNTKYQFSTQFVF